MNEILSSRTPERCRLEHRAFDALGDICFRRSLADGAPIMTVRLGEREASIPLDSVRREFAIADDSADGRMLDLIGTALDFVTSLQPGDRLPAEIRTGEASWRPRIADQQLATAQAYLRFVRWMVPESPWAGSHSSDAAPGRLDPALHQAARVLGPAATQRLGLPESTDIPARLDALAREMSYIETLRHRLLAPLETMVRALARLGQHRETGTPRAETLAQVQRLNTLAYRQIRSRFDDVDVQAADLATVLRDFGRQRIIIRTNRDWLYRNQRAWEPILKRWDGAAEQFDDAVCLLLAETYHFLAPRFMPTIDWGTAHRPARIA